MFSIKLKKYNHASALLGFLAAAVVIKGLAELIFSLKVF